MTTLHDSGVHSAIHAWNAIIDEAAKKIQIANELRGVNRARRLIERLERGEVSADEVEIAVRVLRPIAARLVPSKGWRSTKRTAGPTGGIQCCAGCCGAMPVPGVWFARGEYVACSKECAAVADRRAAMSASAVPERTTTVTEDPFRRIAR